MNYFEIITIISSVSILLLSAKLENPLKLFHLAVLFNVVPFIFMDYQGSNQLRIFGVPLSMLPHFILLGILTIRYSRYITVRLVPLAIIILFVSFNILNMSLTEVSSLSDYLFFIGLIIVILSIHTLKDILIKLDRSKIYDFLRLSPNISVVLITCVFYSYFFGGDAQRGNPAIIMNRNLFSIILILYFHFNQISMIPGQQNKYSYFVINLAIIVCIILLGSRASTLGMIAYLFVVSKYFRYSSVLIVVLAIGFGFNYSLIDFKLIHRFNEVFLILSEVIKNGTSSLIDIKRVALLLTAIEVFKDNWVLGIGVGTNLYKEIALSYSFPGHLASPHNLWLSLLVSFGVFQTCLIVIFVRNLLCSKTVSLHPAQLALIASLLVIWCFNQYILVPLIVLAFALFRVPMERKSMLFSKKNA